MLGISSNRVKILKVLIEKRASKTSGADVTFDKRWTIMSSNFTLTNVAHLSILETRGQLSRKCSYGFRP